MYGIYVAIGIIGILATFLLPETFQEPLAECFEDIDARKVYPLLSWGRSFKTGFQNPQFFYAINLFHRKTEDFEIPL